MKNYLSNHTQSIVVILDSKLSESNLEVIFYQKVSVFFFLNNWKNKKQILIF